MAKIDQIVELLEKIEANTRATANKGSSIPPVPLDDDIAIFNLSCVHGLEGTPHGGCDHGISVFFPLSNL